MTIKKILKLNKSVTFKFNTFKEFLAGMVLKGDEVRNIKNLNFNISDAMLVVKNNELFIDKFIIKNQSSSRLIKLLLKKDEINKIISFLKSRKLHGFVKEVFISENNLIKVILGIGCIKRTLDKKRDQKRSSLKRQLERYIKEESKFY